MSLLNEPITFFIQHYYEDGTKESHLLIILTENQYGRIHKQQ